VGPLTHQGHTDAKSALTAGLNATIGGLTDDCRIGAKQVGTFAVDLQQPGFVAGDFFTGIEHVRHVVRTLMSIQRHVQHRGEGGLHVAGTKSPQHITLYLRQRGVTGHGIKVARDEKSSSRTSESARDHIVANARDLEGWIRGETERDVISDGALVSTDRLNRYQ
jgi:hypothetical protein